MLWDKRLSRRNWYRALFGIGGVSALLPLIGIRPRFRRRVALAGAAKVVEGARPRWQGADRSFRDHPSVRCLVLGDWGSGTELQRRVADSMRRFAQREQPACIISTGDNFYPSGVHSLTDPNWRTLFEDVYQSEGLELPWYAALGNHDYEGLIAPQLKYHRVNPRWNMPAPYYSFSQTADGVTADFFVLDTNTLIQIEASVRQRQISWLTDKLKASTAAWKICIGHHPLHSHGEYGGVVSVRTQLQPLFNKHHVDAYLCGHDHDLQLLKAPEDRFVCVVPGAGGKCRDTAYGRNSLFASTNGGFAYLTLTAEEMYVAFVDARSSVEYAEAWPRRGVARSAA